MPAWNGLRRLSLQAMEHGWSDEDERRMACAAGWLPTGELGQALWGKLRGPVRAFAPRLFELRPDAVIFAKSIGAMHMLGKSPDQAKRVASRMAQSWKALAAAGDVKLVAIRETPRMSEDPPSCLQRERATPAACAGPAPPNANSANSARS